MFFLIFLLWNILSAISNILSALQIEYYQKSSRAFKKSRWTLKDEYVNILSASWLLYIYLSLCRSFAGQGLVEDSMNRR